MNGYYQNLSDALRLEQVSRPCLIIDRDRLDQNLSLIRKRLSGRFRVRISDKSMQSIPLLRYVANHLLTQSFMSFHMTICVQVLKAFPEGTTLFGKPMPADAVGQALRDGVFADNPNNVKRIAWLVDSVQRIEQLGQIARSTSTKLNICLETDVGLHRGGFESPAMMQSALEVLSTWPEISCIGMMGYDSHVTTYPKALGGPKRALADAQKQFKSFVAELQDSQREILNTGGSTTVLSYDRDHPANDVTIGSALVKPTDFDLPGLSELEPAVFIAAPILKVVNVKAPGLSRWTWLLRATGRIPKRGMYIYGGNWMAYPVHPAGMCRTSIFGQSSNQDFIGLPTGSDARVDDLAFFRPSQSEAVLQQFGDIAVYSEGRIVDWWPVLPTG